MANIISVGFVPCSPDDGRVLYSAYILSTFYFLFQCILFNESNINAGIPYMPCHTERQQIENKPNITIEIAKKPTEKKTEQKIKKKIKEEEEEEAFFALYCCVHMYKIQNVERIYELIKQLK